MKGSLRWRVAAAATLVTCGMLLLAGLLLLSLLRFGLTRQLDDRLMTAARGLTQAFEVHEGTIQFEWEGVESGPQLFFTAFDSRGQVVAKSNGRLQFDDTQLANDLKNGTVTFSRLSDASLARTAVLRFLPHIESRGDEPQQNETRAASLASYKGPDDSEITLVVAASMQEIDGTLSLANWLVLGIVGLACLITPLVLWPISRVVMQPIRTLAGQIDSLDANNLQQRIQTGACPTELQPIASRLDELLQRLQLSFAREQQTTANIAHDLRTPLAGLSATLELAGSKSRTTDYYRKTIVDCQHIISELKRLIENILLLARLDAGGHDLVPESIPLRELFDDIAKQLGLADSGHSQRLALDFSKLPSVAADRAAFTQVCANLLINAIQHGEPDEVIAVTSENDAQPRICFSNVSGPIEAADLGRLKERFFQADTARAQTGRNAGLGLTIADQLTRQLGGSLTIELRDKKHFVATVYLPKIAPELSS